MKKRILLITLAILLSFACLVSCGKDPGSNDNPNDNPGNSSTYTIRFYDENGTLLEEKNYQKDETPSYTYTKANDARYTYTVSGWATTVGGTPLTALPSVKSNASYFAVVSKTQNSIELTFDENETDFVGAALPQLNTLYTNGTSALSRTDKKFVEAVYTYVQYASNSKGATTEDLNRYYNVLNEAIMIAKGIGMSDNTGAQKAGEEVDLLLTSIAGLNQENAALVTAQFSAIKAMLQNTTNFPLYKTVIEEGIQAISELIIQAGPMPIDEAVTLMKNAAMEALQTMVAISEAIISDEDQLLEIHAFFDTQMNVISSIVTFQDLTKLTGVLNDTKDFFALVISTSIENGKNKATLCIQAIQEALEGKLIEKETIETVSALLESILNEIESIPTNSIVDLILAQIEAGSTTLDQAVLAIIEKLANVEEDMVKDYVTLLLGFLPESSKLPEDLKAFAVEQLKLLQSASATEDFLAILPEIASNAKDFFETHVVDSVLAVKDLTLNQIETLFTLLEETIGLENVDAIRKAYTTLFEDLKEAKTIVALVTAIQKASENAEDALSTLVLDVLKINQVELKDSLMTLVSLSVSQVPDETRDIANAYVAFVGAKIDGLFASETPLELKEKLETFFDDYVEFFTNELKITEAEFVSRFTAIFTNLDSMFASEPENPVAAIAHIFLSDIVEDMKTIETMDALLERLEQIPSDIEAFFNNHLGDVKNVLLPYVKMVSDLALNELVFSKMDESAFKDSLLSFSESEWNKVLDAETPEELLAVLQALSEDIDTFFQNSYQENEEAVISMIQAVLNALQSEFNGATSTLPIANMLDPFFSNAFADLAKVTTYEELIAFVQTLPENLESTIYATLQGMSGAYFDMLVTMLSENLPTTSKDLVLNWKTEVISKLDAMEDVLTPNELLLFYVENALELWNANTEALVLDATNLFNAMLKALVSEVTDPDVKNELEQFIDLQVNLIKQEILGELEEETPFELNFVLNFLPRIFAIHTATIDILNQSVEHKLTWYIEEANVYLSEENKLTIDLFDIGLDDDNDFIDCIIFMFNYEDSAKRAVDYYCIDLMDEARANAKRMCDENIRYYIEDYLEITDPELLQRSENEMEYHSYLFYNCIFISELDDVMDTYSSYVRDGIDYYYNAYLEGI